MIFLYFDSNTLELRKGESLSLRLLGEVKCVQVDGDDLSRIINCFEGMPIHNTEEPQIWTGDMAKYIVANLTSVKETNNYADGLVALSRQGDVLLKWRSDQRLEFTDLECIENTEYLFATFAEMPWILSKMKNIPYVTDASIQFWAGDIARFIVGQLPSKDGQQ